MQRLGLKVGRVWAFNSRLPFGPDQYDEAQFRHLDYIVSSAAKHNIKLVGGPHPAALSAEQLAGWHGCLLLAGCPS